MSEYKPETQVMLAAAALQRGAFPLWEEFKKALEAYRDEAVKDCINAQSDRILVAQGSAQALAKLHGVIDGAVVAADRLMQQQRQAKK